MKMKMISHSTKMRHWTFSVQWNFFLFTSHDSLPTIVMGKRIRRNERKMKMRMRKRKSSSLGRREDKEWGRIFNFLRFFFRIPWAPWRLDCMLSQSFCSHNRKEREDNEVENLNLFFSCRRLKVSLLSETQKCRKWRKKRKSFVQFPDC